VNESWVAARGWWVDFFLSVGVLKIILILTRGITINYAKFRGICEIFPIKNPAARVGRVPFFGMVEI
jgi:hypothetical protein